METDIRDVKRTLKLEELRDQSVEMVRKELSAGVVAYNLVVQVRRLAAARAGVAPRRLSFVGVWSLVKVVPLSGNEWSLPQWKEKFEWVFRDAAQRSECHWALIAHVDDLSANELIPLLGEEPGRAKLPVLQTGYTSTGTDHPPAAGSLTGAVVGSRLLT